MPQNLRRKPVSDPLTFLAALPKRRRNAILAYVNTLQTDELEDLAIFLKFKRPGRSDDDIATLCGVSRSTVARWERYQTAQPRFEDHMHVRRQPSKWRKTNHGDRGPLDNPNGIPFTRLPAPPPVIEQAVKHALQVFLSERRRNDSQSRL